MSDVLNLLNQLLQAAADDPALAAKLPVQSPSLMLTGDGARFAGELEQSEARGRLAFDIDVGPEGDRQALTITPRELPAQLGEALEPFRGVLEGSDLVARLRFDEASPEAGGLRGIMSAAATTYARRRFGRQPLDFGWASAVVERVQVLEDAIVADLTARGPMNISARARGILTIETVGAEEATARISIESDNRTIGQVLETFVPKFAPRIEETLRAQGIGGITVEQDRVRIVYRALVASLAAQAD